MENMKQAFELYFAKLTAYSQATFGSNPSVSYSGNLDKNLITSAPDNENEVEWQPKLQESALDWSNIEEKIGFSVNDELKNFYSTYYFLMLSGKTEEFTLYLDPITSTEAVTETAYRQYRAGQQELPGRQIFVLGHAVASGNDNFLVCYDNASGSLFCYEPESKHEIPLSKTLIQIIGTMEAVA